MDKRSHSPNPQAGLPLQRDDDQFSAIGPSEPLYRYTQLPGHSWIRLLVLHPGSGDLKCSLLPRTIEAAFLQYEAVSYAWGPQHNPEKLDCDGRVLWIGSNLAAALHAIRNSHEDRVLWVDAVCIDQRDLDERSSQVAMMGTIFSGAKEVLIWVGEDDSEEAEEYFELIRTTNQVIASLVVEHGNIWSIPDLSNASLCRDESRWRMVERLTQRAWFSRVWVLQEVGLARRATIHCGHARLPWSELVELSMCMGIRADLVALTGSARLTYESITDAFIEIWLFFDNSATWRNDILVTKYFNEHRDAYEADFTDILSAARSYKATDIRDHVYAFLGHPVARLERDKSLPSGKIVDADYRISVDEVHFRVAVEILQTEQNGWTILSCVDHVTDPASLDGRRASWIPRWDEEARVSKFGHSYSWYRAGGRGIVDFRSQVAVEEESQCSRVRAITLNSTVVWVSEVVDSYRQDQPIRQLNESVKRVWEQLESLSDKTGPYGDTQHEREHAFSLTVVAGYDTRSTFAAEDNPHAHRNMYTAYKIERNDVMQEDLGMSSSAGEHTEQDRARENKLAVARYIDDQRQLLHHRRIILTSDGYYGLGHRETSIGDQIAVIRGAGVPFLLRPLNTASLPSHQRTYVSQMEQQQGTRAYRLVSECYIQGIMRGQVIDTIDGANEEGLSETDVVIV